MRQNEFTFAITEHIAILEIHPSGWRRELNMVSWNGQSPRYDIRDWDQTHERMSKGIVLTAKEMATVKEAIADRGDLAKPLVRTEKWRDEER